MDVARRVMEHRQFKAVRDAARTKLQFRDVPYGDEIERIARSVTGFPDAKPPSKGTAAVPDVATSAGGPVALSGAKVVRRQVGGALVLIL